MRYWAVLAGVGTIVALAHTQIQMVALTESEPNNALSTPQVVNTALRASRGVVVWSAQIMPQGDQDFYQITVADEGVYSIRVDSNRTPTLTLYNASGEVIGGTSRNGNPDVPNPNAPGLVLALPPGIYYVQVAYHLNLGVCRYALRIFPGTTPPDTDPTEPNNSFDNAFGLGGFSGGELINPTFGFLNYGGQDVDVYAFKVSGSANFLRVRTETYVDTVIEVHTPSGGVLTNDDSDWDLLNGGASEVVIGFASPGTYYVVVRGFGRWGGYYRLRIVAELPTEITLAEGDVLFRLRDLYGSPYRSLLNNADWVISGFDQWYQQGWWFRREGVDHQEFALANLYSFEQIAPNQALLIYQEENLRIGIQYHLIRVDSYAGTLRMDVYVLNLSTNPQVVHLYHYFDPDIGRRPTNSASAENTRLRVQSATGDFCYITPLTAPDFWEVRPWSQTLDRLLDGEPTQLINGTLPFEGDVAGAFQWRLPLGAFAWRRITVHYALNTDTLPLLADVNQDGCVDDADLLEVLFAFGSGTFDPVDLNGDGTVDDTDLLEVLFRFGTGC